MKKRRFSATPFRSSSTSSGWWSAMPLTGVMEIRVTRIAISLPPPPVPLPERDRARGGDVQRLGRARGRERDLLGAGCEHLLGKALTLGAEDEDVAVCELDVAERPAAVGDE